MKALKRRQSGLTEDFSDPAVVARIASWLEQAGVQSIEIETEDRQIRIVMAAEALSTPRTVVQAAARPERAPATPIIAKAPFAGHFLSAHPARNADAAPEGTQVTASDIVGFVRIGPLLMAAHAPQNGTVGSHAVSTGDLVGYGDPLIPIGQEW